jgi:hypothetical protein
MIINKFPFVVSVVSFTIPKSYEYSMYINSLYKEEIDYQVNGGFWERHDNAKTILMPYPEELHKLMTANIIRFKNEEDMLAFKLKFDL